MNLPRIALLLLTALPACAQIYHAVDISPANGWPRTRLNGIAAGKQVGDGPRSLPDSYLFNSNSLNYTDLRPFGYFESHAMAISADGQQQCGFGTGFNRLMMGVLWNGGNPATFVQLGISGYAFAYCLGVDNNEQVGFGRTSDAFVATSHAHLWRNSMFSAFDLHPLGVNQYSRAYGTRAGIAVGYTSALDYAYGEFPAYHATSRAYRWSGTAASAVDIHPAGYDASEALATNGTQHGGWGYLASGAAPQHALLWTGDGNNVVDLHPDGFTTSRVNGLSSTMQVGEGWIGTPWTAGSVRHALLWTGTAAGVIDLNQYLPAGYTHAAASGIDADGTIAMYAHNDISFSSQLPGAPADAIALLLVPGPAPAVQISSVAVNPAPITLANGDSVGVSPGTPVDVTVNLNAPAPAGGTRLNFVSSNVNIVANPPTIMIPEGLSSTTFSVPTFLAVAYRFTTLTKLYATDGVYTTGAMIGVTPVVYPAGIAINAVEGGFGTTGTLTLKIPAQTPGATVTLTNGNPALITIPATVTVDRLQSTVTFPVTTASVLSLTTIPVSAMLNGQIVSGSVTLSPAPALNLTSLTVPSLIGGQSVTGTVTLNTFPRPAAGATITFTSSDTGALQVPATVTVPQGASSVSFPVTSKSTSALKSVIVTATFNGASVTSSVTVNPTPTVTISQADYDSTTGTLKLHADTSYASSVLTFGVDGGGPIGTLALELGTWKGSIVLPVAPRTVTVWNSNGGQATAKVTVTTAGGGGGGGTATSYKISVSKNGKGSVTTNPATTSFAAGAVVTLTATPDPGAPWVGWSGACTGTATTCTLTVNSNLSVTANFR